MHRSALKTLGLLLLAVVSIQLAIRLARKARGTDPAAAPSAPSSLSRALAAPRKPLPAFAGGFSIEDDQTLVLLGGTNALESQRHGYLETLLAMAFPRQRLRLRNLAWQTDTVYRRQRPRNFYGEGLNRYNPARDARQRTAADTVIVWMGQSEALNGPAHRDGFARAYRGLLDELLRTTVRAVLVTPVPFEDPLELGLRPAERNEWLAAYADTIREIARERGLPVVDLSAGLRDREDPTPLTRNGRHLTARGHWLVARRFAEQLGYGTAAEGCTPAWPGGALADPPAEELRQAVIAKDVLWYRYWRPTNWAFLYGNRQFSQGSRDHVDQDRRWFPGEIEATLALVDEAEAGIERIASRLAEDPRE